MPNGFGGSFQVAGSTSDRSLRTDRRAPPGGEARAIDAINPRSHQRPDPTKSRDSDLPRKEVIQPHLPVRLPCYDFVPITNPTLDTSVPRGFGQWLQVLPAFMT